LKQLKKRKTSGAAPRRVAAKKARKRSPRLTVANWVDAAIDVLVLESVDQVRVESLAQSLGVTKGSFYWHFEDRAALLEAVIEEWSRRATLQPEELFRRGNADAREQLRRLLNFRSTVTAQWSHLELAMHAWSRRSRRVRAAVQQVERHRVDYLCGLLAKIGVREEDIRARAYIFYGTARTVGEFLEIESIDLPFLERIFSLILPDSGQPPT
jgi:AcrR family transcriptional regulator